MPKKLSTELEAVLIIFRADNELLRKTIQHIDFELEKIDWDKIWAGCFGGGHSAAIVWAKAIWCDEVATKSDPFDRAFAMSPKLQLAVLKALAMRWGQTIYTGA